MSEPTEHPTTPPLSDERLAQLAAEATDGPWLYDESDGEIVNTFGVAVAEVTLPADGEFIAAARTALPQLLAEVQWLRARVDIINERLARWDEKADALLDSVRPGDRTSAADRRCDEAYQVQQCASEIRAALRTVAQIDAIAAGDLVVDDFGRLVAKHATGGAR